MGVLLPPDERSQIHADTTLAQFVASGLVCHEMALQPSHADRNVVDQSGVNAKGRPMGYAVTIKR